MFLNYHFGELLQKYLKDRGIQQKWLAEKLGISNQAVTKYFTVKNPRQDTAEKILNALGITIEELIGSEKINKVEYSNAQNQKSNDSSINISIEQFQYFMEAVKERDALKQKEIEQLQKQNSREVPVPKVQD